MGGGVDWETIDSGVDTTLDTAGLVPGIDTGADAIATGKAIVQLDLGGVIFGGLGMLIPGVSGGKLEAGFKAVFGKADEAASIAKAGNNEVLYRFGTSSETATRLGNKSTEAEKVIGIHGVSVSAAKPDAPSSQALRSEVEKFFKVHDTPTKKDLLHKTVELTKPVTKEVANLFNSLFGRNTPAK